MQHSPVMILIALIFGPVILATLLYIIIIPFVAAWKMARAFTRPAHVARMLALKPVASPVQPNRDPTTEVRRKEGTCCLCGDVGTWKGLDVYAKVTFAFEGAPIGTSRYTYYFYRYLGWLDVLFCNQCLSESVVRASLSRWVRAAQCTTLTAVLAAILFSVLLMADRLLLWACLITALVGLAACIALVVCLRNVLKPKAYENRLYWSYVYRFIRDAKAELLSACDLTESVLHRRGRRYDPTPNHVSFVVEPSRFRRGEPVTDDNGTQWWESE